MRPLPRSARLASGTLALPLLLGAAACTTPVPPSTRVLGLLDPQLERLLYVTTNAERETVIADLEFAGFRTTSQTHTTPLVLVVKLGNVRRTQPCGSLRNVLYQLHQGGFLVAVIRGRGWTGSCDPGILREMNAELVHLFESRM